MGQHAYEMTLMWDLCSWRQHRAYGSFWKYSFKIRHQLLWARFVPLNFNGFHQKIG